MRWCIGGHICRIGQRGSPSRSKGSFILGLVSPCAHGDGVICRIGQRGSPSRSKGSFIFGLVSPCAPNSSSESSSWS